MKINKIGFSGVKLPETDDKSLKKLLPDEFFTLEDF